MQQEFGIKTTPVSYRPSLRNDSIRGVTSAYGGKLVPIRAIPLLPQDNVIRGSVRLKVDMQETPLPFMNAVGVKAYAHFVPFLVFERFESSHDWNKAWAGTNDPQKPLFNLINAPQFDRDTDNFWTAMGIHMRPGSKINTTYLEAYNAVWNHMARQRSLKINQRDYLDSSLAPAFWSNFGHIKPDYDAAIIDGSVPVSFSNSQAPVTGLYSQTRGLANHSGGPYRGAVGTGGVTDLPAGQYGSSRVNDQELIYHFRDGIPQIFAELEDMGLQLTLADINKARETAAFAKIAKQYRNKMGPDADDYIIDILLQGIAVEDYHLQMPMLVARASTIMGVQRQYATDGASLGAEVSRGQTYLDLTFSTPPINMGGVIMITMQVLPEPIWEHQNDPYLSAQSKDDLPDAMRDYFDIVKVDQVLKHEIDVYHSNGDHLFGYAPLNSKWQRNLPMLGGKYYRKQGDPWNEDRARIWTPDILNPELTENWWVCSDLSHAAFMDENSHPFEINSNGMVRIKGLTQFGSGLIEDGDEYDRILERAAEVEEEIEADATEN